MSEPRLGGVKANGRRAELGQSQAPACGVDDGLIRRPLVLVGAPRSGTTMLFNALSGHPDLWSLYRESQTIIDRFFPVAMVPGRSEQVEAAEVDDAVVGAVARAFFEAAGNFGDSHVAVSSLVSRMLRTGVGRRVAAMPGLSHFRLASLYSWMGRRGKRSPIRLVEKTPENCFRIPLLDRVFPDAQFIHIVRDPRASIASIYRGWNTSQEFRRYDLPGGYRIRGYDGSMWCFGLLPGWESLDGAELIEVCARQWLLYNQRCRHDLPNDPARTMTVAYEQLVADPGSLLERIAQWSGIDPAPLRRFGSGVPVANTLTHPEREKWRQVESEIAKIEDVVRNEASLLGYRF